MPRTRTAGVVVPLFSIRTRRDWGIGQITDLGACAAFFMRAGQTLLQILPPHELSGGETSPYGALTAFGLDPIYIDVDAVPDLDAAGVAVALGAEGARELERVRARDRVDYRAVRALKTSVLHAAFERFVAREWERSTPRAAALAAFIERESEWLDDLALYTAMRETHEGWGWETWPEDDRERAPRAIERARTTHAKRILEVGYLQWVAIEQWTAARAELSALGVELMGDLPFVVCGESADVWARAAQFQGHMSLGAPPDAFSPDGQDWGLPPYNWLAMEGDDLAWIRARTRHAARLYDRFRLDHVVGFFRQWVKRKPSGDGVRERGRFDPEGADAERARGQRVLGAIVEDAQGARVIAEDLGVIPPFVRETMGDLHVPGYRVIPWERDDNGQLRDPAAFPASSVASWSTHDTAPITSWWDDLSDDDKAQLAARASITSYGDEPSRTEALLALLYRSGSELALVLAQELLGDGARINTPGVVGEGNWTYRLPAPIEDLERDPRILARLEAARGHVTASGR
jgi:4-alpha-glucanotransferase